VRMSEVPEVDDANHQEPKAKLARGMSTVKTKKGLRLSRADGADIVVDDLDGDNIVMTQEEFNSMVRNISVKGERVQNLRRYLGVAAIIIFILAVVSFAMSWLAAEASKESHVEGAVLVNTQGEPVEVASSDFKVNDNGMLVKQCHNDGENSCNSRRLSGTGEISVTTTPTKHRQVLASSMSDAYLMSLTEIVVFSDKGHTLRVSVHGFARVPVNNSRCGNIVHFYTAWNGRLSLDSQELSFDDSTEEAFLNAGFSLVVGGVSGRRLTSQHSVEGFFTAVEGMEESDGVGWDCHDVPLPALPQYFSHTMTIYQACAVAGATGSAVDPCDSDYGGVVPGVHALPEQHQLAIMSKTARIKSSLSVDVPVEQTLFVKTEVEVLKTPGYQIQRTWMANHPGQIKVSVYDREVMESVEFQLLADFVSDGRFYCNSSAGDTTFQKSEQEAEASGVDTSMHFEFLGLAEEGGSMYRHFRMMSTDAFLTWMEAVSTSERPADAYYEYWDSAETLAPYRLLTPDGSIIIFEATTQDADDGAAETLLGDMGLGTDSVMTCGDEEQDPDEPMNFNNGFELPKMVSAMIDLNPTNLQFYVWMIGGHEDEDWVENTTASNAGWDSLDAIIEGGGELADFAGYARRSVNPMAMPDVCKSFCSDLVDTVAAAALAPDSEEFCETPGLDLLLGCVFQEGTAASACGMSPLAMSLQECEDNGFIGRRLSKSDELNEVVDFEEEEEEDNMKVTTIASGALARAADPEPPMPVLSKLADGSNSVDLADLDDGTRAQLARILNLTSPPETGRILFNSTVPKPGDEVKNMPGLVDLPGIDVPATSRRLFIDMMCLFPNVGPGCIFSVWWPKSGQPTCDPIGGTGNMACKYSLAVKIQLTGPAAGALSIGGGGCIEAWQFSVPPPFDGSVCIAGTITAGFGRACGNKFPFTLGGYVSITAAVGLNFGLFSITAASIGVGVGAGISNYATHCWSNRRRRRWWGGGTRRCNYDCDFRVYGDARLNIGPGRFWARVEYWIRHRSFQMHIGADVCWPWPISSCSCIVSVRVI